jgi:large subunit ribosomal protein L15
MLQAHTIKPKKGTRKKSKRLGRGNASGKGNFSTRGMKGQRARSGGKGGLKLKGFKHILQATPKLRGFNSGNVRPVEITLATLERAFNNGDTVDLKILKEKNLLKKSNSAAKVIVKGQLTKRLIISGLKTTKGAVEAITKVGGEVK